MSEGASGDQTVTVIIIHFVWLIQETGFVSLLPALCIGYKRILGEGRQGQGYVCGVVGDLICL